MTTPTPIETGTAFYDQIKELSEAVEAVGFDRPFTLDEYFAVKSMILKALHTGHDYAQARWDSACSIMRGDDALIPHPNAIKGDKALITAILEHGDSGRDLGAGGAK